jgi:hypothetical protein
MIDERAKSRPFVCGENHDLPVIIAIIERVSIDLRGLQSNIAILVHIETSTGINRFIGTTPHNRRMNKED